LDVADHNAAVWSILTNEECAGNTYNIDGFVFNQQMLRDMLFILLGDTSEKASELSINNKVTQTLNWTPSVELLSLVQQNIDAYWSSVEV